MSNHVKDVIGSLKNKNDELIQIMSDINKTEELLNIKNNFPGLPLVFVMLLVFELVATCVLK